MPGAKPLPASLRHLKAKLKILRRPTVLGSVSILLLAAWFLGDYWHQSLNDVGVWGTGANSRLITPADPDAQPSSLDPLSSVEDLPSEEIPALPDASALDSPSPTDPFLTSLPSPNQSATAQPDRASSWQSPFSSSRLPSSSAASNSLIGVPEINAFPRSSPTPAGTSSISGTGMSGTSSISGNSASGSIPSASPANPLQSALDRHSAPNSSATEIPQSTATSSPAPENSPANSQPNYSPTPPASQFYFPQPLPGQPAPTQTLIQPQYLPQTSPAAGSTGYTVPPALQTPASTGTITNRYTPYSTLPSLPSTQPNQSIVPTLPNSASPPVNAGSNYPATAQPQFTVPQSNPAPFSVPRRAPGQSIGGGQINTFSNP